MSDRTLTFDARALSAGWLSVAQASTKAKDRPVLDRTMAVEFFPDGVRLAATDSYVLLYAWVPALGYKHNEKAPDFDDAPDETVVARDPDGRAAGLLAYLRSQTEDEEAPDIEVSLGIADGSAQPTHALSFAGFEGKCLVVEGDGREALRLDLSDDDYPHWRGLLVPFTPRRTDAIALSPEIIGRLAKLDKLHPGQSLVWQFGGTDKMARLRIGTEPVVVEGAVMPMRLSDDDLARIVGQGAARISEAIEAELNAVLPDDTSVTVTVGADAGSA